MRNQIVLLSMYNEWMNSRLYEAAGQLSAEELAAHKGAFFGSLLGTLNHVVVGDRIWLRRFAAHPSRHAALQALRALPVPTSVDEILYSDLERLAEHRRMLDAMIRQWAESLTDQDLKHVLRYVNTKGVAKAKRFSSLIVHFFNHQTHHRGQATTLLSQAGIDVGVTDLLELIPDEDGE